ncbi:MAG: TrmH family RNA methyltransferase [Psychroflexus sp.]|uniref:TrmH family RNA methyltransferase n=1 Tax=Psychroflexus sp. S27 TaxID=1982757 RepID=UPI000C29AF27|nr:TrmH family RNA methyltransferase [Psychroflexus sp. S27]PJX20704.1 hypothetical protein CAP47_10690 [Psychroflexus sp. S27]
MSHQLTHSELKNKASKAEIYILLDDVASPANLGSIFRLADAFGVQKIFIHEDLKETQSSTRFKRTSRSTEKFVETCFFKNITKKILELKSENKKLIGLELTSESQGINTYPFDVKETYILILGNERLGISNEVLTKLDACLHIDLFGQNSSINVAQSCGIGLYEITRQLNS